MKICKPEMKMQANIKRIIFFTVAVPVIVILWISLKQFESDRNMGVTGIENMNKDTLKTI